MNNGVEKTRGRPRREIPEQLRAAIEAATPEQPASVEIGDATPDEVKELRTAVSAGARHIGGKARFRTVQNTLYFWVDPTG